MSMSSEAYLFSLLGLIVLTNLVHIIVDIREARASKKRDARQRNFQNKMLLMNRPRVASVKKHIATRSTPLTQEPSERRKHD